MYYIGKLQIYLWFAKSFNEVKEKEKFTWELLSTASDFVYWGLKGDME